MKPETICKVNQEEAYVWDIRSLTQTPVLFPSSPSKALQKGSVATFFARLYKAVRPKVVYAVFKRPSYVSSSLSTILTKKPIEDTFMSKALTVFLLY